MFNIIKFKNIKQNRCEFDFCFVCMSSEIEPIKLNTQCIYLKKCDCDGFIHDFCLNKWYLEYKSCPICRQQIIYNYPLLNYKNKEILFFLYYFFVFFSNKYNFLKIISLIYLIFILNNYFNLINFFIYLKFF
jgi:hypothetical protein